MHHVLAFRVPPPPGSPAQGQERQPNGESIDHPDAQANWLGTQCKQRERTAAAPNQQDDGTRPQIYRTLWPLGLADQPEDLVLQSIDAGRSLTRCLTRAVTTE